MNIIKSTLKFIQTEICSVSVFIFMNSSNKNDCMNTDSNTDSKECEDCIVVTDIPSPKRCKLEPE